MGVAAARKSRDRRRRHNGRFNYKTGEAMGAPVCINLKTYPVKVEAGKVLVQLS